MTDDTSAALGLTPEERYIAHLERMSGGMVVWRIVPSASALRRYAVMWYRATTVFYSIDTSLAGALAGVAVLLVNAGHLAPQDR